MNIKNAVTASACSSHMLIRDHGTLDGRDRIPRPMNHFAEAHASPKSKTFLSLQVLSTSFTSLLGILHGDRRIRWID